MKAMITYQQLKDLGTCARQLTQFHARFGDGPVAVTAENCTGFDLDWAAEHLLSPVGYAAYVVAVAPAEAVHAAIRDQAVVAYETAMCQAKANFRLAQARIPAWVAYETAAMAPVWAAHNAATAQAWGVYAAAINQAKAVYQSAQAAAFVEIYNRENP